MDLSKKMNNSTKALDYLRALMPTILGSLILLGCHYDSLKTEAIVSPNTERPNFLFILTDDQNYRTIRELGNKHIFTPNLDKLTQRGMSFSHVFNQGSWEAAVCGPSRKMLNTGRHLFKTGYGPSTAVNDQSRGPLLGEILQQNGYDTFITGKWHIDEESLRRSFTSGSNIFMPLWMGMSFHEEGGQFNTLIADYDGNDLNDENFKTRRANKFSNELFVDSAIGYLKKKPNDSQNPFFLYLSFLTPHDPKHAPEKYLKLYPIDDIPIPKNMLREHPFNEGDHNARDEVLLPFPRTELRIRWHIARYYAMVSHLDAEIGRLLDYLEKSELADNTVIIFTSDNGLANGQHGLLGKQNQYDHSIRVPLIFAGPSVDAGIRKTGMFYLHSLFPTILDIAEIEAPKTTDSVSIASLLSGKKDHVREYIYGAYKNFQRMVRTSSHKLIYYPHIEKTQLFDMINDPLEIHDISKNEGNEILMTKLLTELERLKLEVGDPLKNESPVKSFSEYKKDDYYPQRWPRRELN
ncbi:MAG: sulfatase [Porticoccaceae bacterium]|nr:sulfatase [Porticoccaceae bacterium]